jgi:aspartyl-tRNA(Asn)/glutamyl-tRNA(Gln) amidotransferase subunit A
VLESTIRTFEKLGAEISAVELPSPQVLIATYYVIANAEASSNLARFDGVRYGRRAAGVSGLDSLYRTSRGEGFGVEVKRRILVGTFVLSAGYYDAYYGEALRVRRELREQVSALRTSVDAILLPTAPTPAFRLGEKLVDPLSMYLSDLFTIGANLIGNAAVTFPAGKSSDGLPIGMQLYGLDGAPASSSLQGSSGDGSDGAGSDPRGGSQEEALLRLVRAFELAADGLGSLTDPASPLHTWGRA